MTDRLTQSMKPGMEMGDSMLDTMMTAMDGASGVEQNFHLVEHGVHIALMGVVLVMAVLGTFFLVRFFLRPVTSKAFRSTLFARALRPFEQPARHGGNWVDRPLTGREEDTFLVIPDISGYTRFIKLNRFSVGHAQYVIGELLDAIIDAARPVLRPTRIEGDAIMFHAVSAADEPRGGVTGDQVGLAILDLLNAFYAKRAELRHDNACPCEVCRRIDDLQLKVVVHRGPLLHYRVKDFEDFSGLPIIAARRLLKNSLDRDQYILVTEAAADAINLPLAAVSERHVERCDDFGEIAARVYEFEPLVSVTETSIEHHGPIAGRMRDAVKKLAQNARTLGRSVGPSASQLPAE